jgi:hypothetical protein
MKVAARRQQHGGRALHAFFEHSSTPRESVARKGLREQISPSSSVFKLEAESIEIPGLPYALEMGRSRKNLTRFFRHFCDGLWNVPQVLKR